MTDEKPPRTAPRLMSNGVEEGFAEVRAGLEAMRIEANMEKVRTDIEAALVATLSAAPVRFDEAGQRAIATVLIDFVPEGWSCQVVPEVDADLMICTLAVNLFQTPLDFIAVDIHVTDVVQEADAVPAAESEGMAAKEMNRTVMNDWMAAKMQRRADIFRETPCEVVHGSGPQALPERSLAEREAAAAIGDVMRPELSGDNLARLDDWLERNGIVRKPAAPETADWCGARKFD